MSILLQVSDTHFGTEQPAVVAALIAFARAQRPDLVVHSGDITQRARASEFRTARWFADQLEAPLLAIPGNHDIALFDVFARMFRPYALHRATFGDDLEPVHDSPGRLVIGVNTTRRWRHKHGEVSPRQVERVAQRLHAAGRAQLRVVVVHQPVGVTCDEDVRNLLRGSAAAVPRWASAGADLIIGGHIHLPYVMALPGCARALWTVQAGTAVSSRVRGSQPNSVNLLHWPADEPGRSCRIEQWDYSLAHGAFRRVRQTWIEPDRD